MSQLDFNTLRHTLSKSLCITVGNFGYQQLVSNFLWNIEETTDLFPHTVVFSYDQKLIDYLKEKHPTAHVHLLPFDKVSHFDFKDAVAFKERHWDELTLYKLYVIWWLMSRMEPDSKIFYSDADIYYTRSPLPFAKHEITHYKMLIQEGVSYQTRLGYCSGILFVPTNDLTKALFDPKNWNHCNTDDENYIKTFVKSNSFETDVGLFPNDRFAIGTLLRQPDKFIRTQLKAGTYVCIHFNYIKGIDAKIAKMRELGMWLRAMEIVNVPKQFQPNLNAIVREKRGDFPPHQSSFPQIEEYASEYFTNYCAKRKQILSEYDYLPVFWTAIGCSGDQSLKRQLQDYITRLLARNPTQKYWTIVQHCAGVNGACGVVFPANRLRIIGTTLVPLTRSNAPQGSQGITTTAPVNAASGKLHLVIPLICAQHPVPTIQKPRLTFASFIGCIKNHPIRQRLQQHLLKKSGVVIDTGDYKKGDHVTRFRELMADSVFALCPRGVGSTSYRLVEAMQFGAIPVYISDVFSLPFPKEIDWNTCSVLVKQDELPGLYERLRKIPPTQIKKMQETVKKVYDEYLTLEGCCEHIVRYV